MTCREALDFLSDYLDGRLPLMQRLSFGFHLCLCRSCRNYLDSYRKTIQVASVAQAESFPAEELPEDLIQAILASRSHGPRVD